jgi:hypothetical protein
MKKINLLVKLLFAFTCIVCAQNESTIQLINYAPKTVLPFFESKKAVCSRTFGFHPSNLSLIPMKGYDNLNLTSNSPQELVQMFRRFDFSSSFYVVSIEVGESDWETQYIATINSNGDIIDFIETGVLFYTTGTIAIKQYSITSDYQVTVYWLNVLSPTNVDPFNFTTVTAQRIDKVYKIDTSGHFSFVKQLTYQPKNYIKTDMENKSKDIWLGGEVHQ